MGVTDGPPSSGSENGTANFTISDTFEVPEDTSSDNTNTDYTVVEINVSSDSTITATSTAEDFRYEVGTDGVSKEGAYNVTIDGFDKSNDKLTLVLVGATSNITTQEFDAIKDVEVTSDGISGTQIFFAPDSDLESGRLILPSIEESFSDIIEDIKIKYNCQDYTDSNKNYIFTIDPSDCKDFDDAVSISENTINVYIANVAVWIDYFKLWGH